MIKLTERVAGEIRPIWIVAAHIIYVVEGAYGSDIRLRDDIVRSVTEPPETVVAMMKMRGSVR